MCVHNIIINTLFMVSAINTLQNYSVRAPEVCLGLAVLRSSVNTLRECSSHLAPSYSRPVNPMAALLQVSFDLLSAPIPTIRSPTLRLETSRSV